MDQPSSAPPSVVLSGLIVDSRDRLAAVMQSAETVAVCMRRIEVIPTLHMFQEWMVGEMWVVVSRTEHNSYFTVHHGRPGENSSLPEGSMTAAQRESVQMAIEAGLALWPEWSPPLRESFNPKRPILLYMGPELEEV